jgi:hypothetical protein
MTKRSVRRLLSAVLLVGLVALFAAACGSSQQATSSSAAMSTSTSEASGQTADTTATSDSSQEPASSSNAGASGSIVFSGLIDYPMTFTALDMDYMDWVTVTADDPQLGSTEYEGVKLSDIFSYVGVQSDATALAITGSDGTTAEVTLADISSDALLAVADDGSLSTVMPGMASEAWVKDIVKMEFR